MTDLPKVSVVILNWNGLKHLKDFLPSVCRSTYPKLEIIVADNASNDLSLEFLKADYPEIRIIRNDKNYGFAGGYNKSLGQVESDYFVLLNSDVAVEPDWIQPVIALMQSNPLIAAAQPKILSHTHPEKFEYAGAAGGFIDVFGYPFCRGRIFDHVESDNGQYDDTTEIFWASGAALFIKREKWIEAGGLDEDFFAHMEEIDLCWRLKNRGYKIMYCPQSRVYHLGGGTLNSESPFKTYLNFRNSLIVIQKNQPFYYSGLIVFSRLWLDLLSIFKYLLDGKPANAWAVSRAHQSFFRSVFINARKARKIDRSKFNKTGLRNISIVWQYFVLKRKTYNSL
ncbi:MAG TPA: glycosyltransferase family 2 protein [Daejeonella sp.]